MATELSTSTGGVARLRDVYKRSRSLRLPWLSLSIIAILLTCAAFAPLLAPHEPDYIRVLDAKLAPGEDWSYPLGTDVLGRDMLSRLIYGARTALLISLVALGSGAVLGTVLGLISGYRGGWVDALIMRAVHAAMGFPTILVTLIIVVILGPGVENIVVAVVVTVWKGYARMIWGEVLSIKEMEFVTMAKVAGVTTPVIIWRHVFPNTINTVAVLTSLEVPGVILLEASLSFLGLGVPQGSPAWGIMVAEGRTVILDVWWLPLFPGLAITAVVLAFNFFGDWLRDYMDPKLRRTR